MHVDVRDQCATDEIVPIALMPREIRSCNDLRLKPFVKVKPFCSGPDRPDGAREAEASVTRRHRVRWRSPFCREDLRCPPAPPRIDAMPHDLRSAPTFQR